MSTQVISQIEYYKIGKTLRLDYNFINRLYEANQKEYDSRYNESNNIESLDKELYNNNSLEVITEINTKEIEQISETINGILRSIRYNSESELNQMDLTCLDQLIIRTDVKEVLI